MRNFGLSPVTIKNKFPLVPLTNLEENLPKINVALNSKNILERNVVIAAHATILVETAWTYAPISEYGGEKYFTRMYEGRSDLGNTQVGDGVRFKGRGFVMVTGRANYQHFSKHCGVDLCADPDKANNGAIAALILAAYFKERGVVEAARAADWVKVRKLVNGGRNGLSEFLECVEKLEMITAK